MEVRSAYHGLHNCPFALLYTYLWLTQFFFESFI